MLLKFLKQKFLILFFIIALSLRTFNPFFGSPVLYVVPDEVSNYMSALNMISQKTLYSTTSQYMPFGSYIQIPFISLSYVIMLFLGKINSVSDFQFFLTTHEGYFLFIPRIISGIFGALSIIPIYFLAKILFPGKKNIAVWSVILFTFSLNNIQLSHLGKPWSPSLFFYLLSVYFVIKSINNKNANLLMFLSAVSIILSFGFLQIAFYAFLLFLLIKLLYFKKKNLLSGENRFFYLNIIFISVSCIFLTYLVKFKPSLGFLFYFNNGNNKSFFNLLSDLIVNNSSVFFIKQLFLTETIILLFALPAFLHRKVWRKPILGITIYIIVYFLLISLLFWQASRYLLPIIIFLPIYASFTINLIEKRLKTAVLIRTFRLLLLIFVCYLPILWNLKFLKEPTFIQSKKWIDSNIPPATPIISTSIRFNPFVPGYEAIKMNQRIFPSSYSLLSKFLTQGYYPDNVRNIYFLDKIISKDENAESFSKKNNIGFIINYYWNPKDSYLYKNRDTYYLIKIFSPLINKKESVEISNMYSTMNKPDIYSLLPQIDRAGPYIEILGINTSKPDL